MLKKNENIGVHSRKQVLLDVIVLLSYTFYAFQGMFSFVLEKHKTDKKFTQMVVGLLQEAGSFVCVQPLCTVFSIPQVHPKDFPSGAYSEN